MTERHRSWFVLLLVSGLIAASVAVLTQRDTKLGLDLQGGVQLVYEAEPTSQQPTITPEALQRAVDIMRERVDALGVSEPELLQSGRNQIEVNLPGVENAERAAQQVGSTAQLFFYDWEANLLDRNCRTDANENANEKQPITGFFQAVRQASRCDPQRDGNNSAADRPRFYAFDEVSERALNNGQPSETREAALEDLDAAERERVQVVEVPEGILVVRDQKARADAPDPDRFWVVQDNPALSGTDIRNPEQDFQQGLGNEPNVRFEFTDRGGEAFQEVTRAIAQRGRDNAFTAPDPQHFAIVLDDELVSAPSIDYVEYPDGIDGRTGAEISGSFTIGSAQDLAEILKIGALPVRLELVTRSQVSASLGQQALDRGVLAGLAGFAIVVVFLLVFYRVLGVIASVAMAIYGLYLYAIVELIPIVLTLPGIAGMILTLGVAADANIVIFERVKEEIRAGRGVGAAISAGYKKGLTAILDANIVTILVAFILFVMATSGVRGFALTLGVGVIVLLFTAVLATQAMLYGLRRTRLLRSRAALGARDSKPIRFDFIGGSRWFFSMSGLILLICAVAIAIQGLNFGIDFEGGTRITAPLERAATVDAGARHAGAARARRGRDPDRRQPRAGAQRRPDQRGGARPERGRPGRGHPARAVRVRRRPELAIDRRQLRPNRGRERDPGHHRLADRHLDLHHPALPMEVRGPGADRPLPRPVDHHRRLRAHRPGGDGLDGGGPAHHPGLLPLRHHRRLRPRAREHSADAQRRLLADLQPLDVRGDRALAGHQPLRHAADPRAAAVRRRDDAGLRLRAARRDHLRHLLVGVHRRPRAHPLEGTRARLPGTRNTHPSRTRRRPRLRRRPGSEEAHGAR